MLKLIHSVQPSIVCLQETKVEVINTFLGMQLLGQRLCNFDTSQQTVLGEVC